MCKLQTSVAITHPHFRNFERTLLVEKRENSLAFIAPKHRKQWIQQQDVQEIRFGGFDLAGQHCFALNSSLRTVGLVVSIGKQKLHESLCYCCPVMYAELCSLETLAQHLLVRYCACNCNCTA